jgi:AcrR family transcriptional regulator
MTPSVDIAARERSDMTGSAGGEVDPRIARTRELLWSALVRLIDERGYASISVSDIASRAGLNRATFYRHFEDKDDLFRKGCSAFFDSLFLELETGGPPAGGGALDWSEEYFGRLFQLVRDRRETFAILGGKRSDPEFTHIMRDKVDAFTIERRLELFSGPREDQAAAELDAAAVSSLLSGLLAKWFVDTSRFPLEKVQVAYRSALTGGIPPYSGSR